MARVKEPITYRISHISHQPSAIDTRRERASEEESFGLSPLSSGVDNIDTGRATIEPLQTSCGERSLHTS